MAVNFGTPPTLINLDDPTPGGGVSTGTKAPATIIDNTFPANDPWGQFVQQQKGYEQQAKINKLTAAATAAADKANNPDAPSYTEIAKGVPNAMWQIATNPLDTAYGASYNIAKGFGALADLPVHIINSIFSMLPDKGTPLPLLGQTLFDYLDKANSDLPFTHSDVAESVGAVTRQLPGYELGGAAARGVGVLGKGLVSRVAGNVAGGQLTTPFDTSPSDRANQAAFDTAFGVVHTGALALTTALKGSKAAAEALSTVKNGVISNAITGFEKADSSAYNPEVANNLRSFLESKAFSKPTTMADFETNLQKHLGDSFYDPKVNSVLQPIIDAGHDQFATVTGVKGKVAPQVQGPISAQDVLGDPNVLQAKAEANARSKADASAKATAAATAVASASAASRAGSEAQSKASSAAVAHATPGSRH